MEVSSPIYSEVRSVVGFKVKRARTCITQQWSDAPSPKRNDGPNLSAERGLKDMLLVSLTG
jgi:hypothetical protein